MTVEVEEMLIKAGLPMKVRLLVVLVGEGVR